MSMTLNVMARFSIVTLFVFAHAACSDSGAGSATPTPVPQPSFAIACSPSPLVTSQGCGSATCTVTSENGFSGRVGLSCSDLPSGVKCYVEPFTANVPSNGSATVGFAVSVDAVLGTGPQRLRVVASAGSLASAADVDLIVNGLLAPEIRGKAMTITGCAGYVEGIVNARDLRQFRSVFVGAWRFRERGEFCEQTLSADDGAFNLVVPRCFREGQTVFLTAGGLNSCVTVPYRQGTVARVDLFGQRQACP